MNSLSRRKPGTLRGPILIRTPPSQTLQTTGAGHLCLVQGCSDQWHSRLSVSLNRGTVYTHRTESEPARFLQSPSCIPTAIRIHQVYCDAPGCATRSRTRHGDGESGGEPMSAQTSDFVIPGLVVYYANDRVCRARRWNSWDMWILSRPRGARHPIFL